MNSNQSRRSFLASLGGGAAAASVPEAFGRQTMPGASSPIACTGDKYILPRKVLLWECTRKEIREAIESGRLKAAIIPTGSTEQHNEHLAMIHDTASVLLVAQNAALQLYPQAVVATPVPIGISPYWMERKGTLTLRPETFLAVVYDICDSLKTHGINTVLILAHETRHTARRMLLLGSVHGGKRRALHGERHGGNPGALGGVRNIRSTGGLP
jgi:hypothetical protein